MSLPIPLTVRLSTARADRHIERDLRSLSFRSVAPGGFASAQFSLDRPLAMSPDEIAYYADVDIYDARNGECVWCGRLEDPGRGVGADGQVWDLAAVGPSAHARDSKRPLHYIDTSLQRWESMDDPAEDRFRINTRSSSSGVLALRWTTARDTILPTGIYNLLRYRTVDDSGLKLARIAGELDSGITDTLLITEIITRTGTGGSADVAISRTWNATGAAVNATTAGSITPGRTVVEIRVRRSTSQLTVANDSTTEVLKAPFVQAMRMKADGTEITDGYSANALPAHSAVNDMLGRLLTEYDGANAHVENDSYNIDQLIFPDGVTPAEVFDALMMLEPTKYWAAWERNSAGKYRFEWRAWPTTVRYEADIVDGYSSSGSADGLFNRCTVRYRDLNDRVRFYTATSTVPALDDAGLVREEFLDLADELGSASNAARVATLFLDEHQSPPNAGQLTVARPIYDHVRGTMVMPWEIRPGHLMRVRGIQPKPDELNATDRDGVTVFKVVAVDYDTSSASATVDFDSQPLTLAHMMARRGASARFWKWRWKRGT
jgi:hypothetical protein